MRNCIFTLAAAMTLAMSLTSAANANDLELSLNDDAVRLVYAWPAREDKLRIDAGLLHHQDRGELVHVGLHLEGLASSGNNPLHGGLGGRVVYANTDGPSDDAFALALGGYLKYTFPAYNRFSVQGHAYFAPDILNFGDADQFVELDARVSYNVLRNGDIFLGARYINLEFQPGGDFRLDNGLHAGIQLRF